MSVPLLKITNMDRWLLFNLYVMQFNSIMFYKSNLKTIQYNRSVARDEYCKYFIKFGVINVVFRFQWILLQMLNRSN